MVTEQEERLLASSVTLLFVSAQIPPPESKVKVGLGERLQGEEVVGALPITILPTPLIEGLFYNIRKLIVILGIQMAF